jgi:CDP-diacylglycerol---glycerol-3-phosphate 3-phosphatidyltransferase
VTDAACSVAILAAILVAAIAYAVRVASRGRVRHARVDRAGASPLLGSGAQQMGYWAMAPAARACIALGIGADAVSWTSLALGVGAGVALATGHFGVGAALSLVSSACDALDGMVARETGTASDRGEVLDATVDRYVELAFLGGVAYWARTQPVVLVLALVAIAGAVMVSYATAKAEAMRVEAPRGVMRRQERAVYLALGAALVPLAAIVVAATPGLPAWAEETPILVALGLVGVFGNASAVYRLHAVAKATSDPRPPLPAERDHDPRHVPDAARPEDPPRDGHPRPA